MNERRRWEIAADCAKIALQAIEPAIAVFRQPEGPDDGSAMWAMLKANAPVLTPHEQTVLNELRRVRTALECISH